MSAPGGWDRYLENVYGAGAGDGHRDRRKLNELGRPYGMRYHLGEGDPADWGDKSRFHLLPHGVPHAIHPGSTPPPKVVQISSPGGWECVVEALIEHRTEVSRDGRFDPAALNRYTRRHVVYEENE
ncbi:hypothetical protein [Actinoallomurus rhizosphaericola]|uniref:hypothetical protein n=1 Tax=Actinoallomurus rhizosphaericola TaxID=2952536 RepID=UPI002090E11C|nr:hypothetical protein [Actinoallomurus rhizosphaericola]MCO5992708.1 hypothetical protein [Actinoallomurus rhizosphaericola]